MKPDEQGVYDAAVRKLEDLETLAPLADARQVRAELRDLEAERRRLEQRRQQLEAEIAALESALVPQARQLLGAEE